MSIKKENSIEVKKRKEIFAMCQKTYSSYFRRRKHILKLLDIQTFSTIFLLKYFNVFSKQKFKH